MLAIPRNCRSQFVACCAAALTLALVACGTTKSSSCEIPDESAGAPADTQGTGGKTDTQGTGGKTDTQGTGGNAQGTGGNTQGVSGSGAETPVGAAGDTGTAGSGSETPQAQAGSGSTQTPPDDTEPEAPDVDVVTFPDVGATEFETATEEPSSGSYSSSNGSRTGVAGGAEEASDTSAPTADDPSAAGGAETATREIVEADIVQMSGNILYVLNSYRGLVLIDMSQPDSPFVAGRVPFQATPVDMYLREGRAYIVMSDYFTYWQFDEDADPLGFHGSRILVVDVDDPNNPQTITGYNIDGEVTDTRIVGDVLYAVSHRNPEYWRYDTNDWEDTTWVLSINVADPDDIHEVDRETFPGASQVIQVFPSSISVAAVDPNYYLVNDTNSQQTLITYLDISDPAGEIRVGGTAYVPGVVPDKFKMDLYDDHLRIVSNNWYWQSDSPATLSVFDVSDPSVMTPTAQIEVAGDVADTTSYVRPQATRFDQAKLLANLCWYVYTNNRSRQVCRIDLYDLADPNAPEKVGEIAAAGAVTHFEPRGDRIIALGTHIVNETTWTSQVRLELFDVSNLAVTRSLSAIDIGDEYSSSTALNDYKALKVLDDLNMVLLPLNWSVVTGQDSRGNDIYTYYQGAQIVDWQDDALTERGRIAQQGTVERAIAFQDRVVSISDKQVQVIDASDRDNPVATASVFLVRNIVDVFDMNGYEVQIGYDEEDSSFRFFVLPFGEDDLAESVAELEIGNYVYLHLVSGNIIRLIGYDPASGQQIVRNVDFSDPTQPAWRGELLVPKDIGSIVTNYSGGYYGGYWGYYNYYWSNMVGKALDNDL
ncbi:MAG: beta-propeller domain-containing protein, partial [Polyangiaceae bacterium]|nr:beta-propeller domain-containing protein [Polyangiaceae bacterium]